MKLKAFAIVLLSACLLAFTHSPTVYAVDVDEMGDPRPDANDMVVAAAVDRGLAHLAKIQNSDGSWSNDIGNKLGDRYQVNRNGVNKPHVGVTAICCMAFMSAGHTPYRGRYHMNVAAGLRFIQDATATNGWISKHESRMYSHAFAALFLAEVYGQTNNNQVRDKLRQSTEFILKTQNDQGAWRYSPAQLDSDMSICVCQLQAMRAAANVGVIIKKEDLQIVERNGDKVLVHKGIEAAKMYVRRSYVRPGDAGFSTPGSFRYQLDWDGRATFALTAAGVVALQSAGEYGSHSYVDPADGRTYTIDFAQSIQFLRNNRPDRSATYLTPGWQGCDYGFWYGHYYSAQAMYQYQFVNERYWTEWNEQNRKHFLKLQHSNGAWTDEIGGWSPENNAFATAMACLILSIPRGLLPIFQA
jgi:hypothetical protein